MERIELADFLLIAESYCGIPAKQLARMARTVWLAQSAIAAPFAGFGDTELHPEFHAKAAIYCSRTIGYHPLPDGNKRTGYTVMRIFIARNGRTFAHPNGNQMETASMIEQVASGSTSEAQFVGWVEERLI